MNPTRKRCKAHLGDGSGQQCKKWAKAGLDVCLFHGGKTQKSQNKSDTRKLSMRLNGELVKRGWEPVDNPTAAFLDQCGEALAWQSLCREKLAEMHAIDYQDAKMARDIVPMITLYERASVQAREALRDVIRLGIEDRVAKSAELTAEANLEAMRGLIRAARASDASEDELILGMLAGAMH